MIEEKKKFKLVSEKNPRIILPNALTILGVCIGISSIKFALDSNYGLAVVAIIVAAIFDALDGRIARLIKGTSKVGKELDSLTDVISFGVAPAFIMFFWTLNEIGKLGWLVVLLYVVCCALRLARFNITSNQDQEWKENFFEGVPSPSGAILVLLPLVFYMSNLYEFDQYKTTISAATFIFVAFLMVSKIPTYSLKRIAIPRKTTVFLLLGICLYFGLLVIYTFKVIFISGIIYLLFIPISYLHFKRLDSNKNNLKNIDETEEPEDIL